MVILIDYHTEESAEDLIPEDWLALIVGHAPERAVPVQPGWKHCLKLEFADDSTRDSARIFGEPHAEAVSDFFWTLMSDPKPFALAIRCIHGRHNAAAMALALGQRIGRYVPAFAPYNRRIYDLLRLKLMGPEARATRRAALVQRINLHLNPSGTV